jgi:chemotaxis protein histidine kinase CheA
MKFAKLFLSATLALAYVEEYEAQYAPAPFFDDSQVDQAYVEQQFQTEEDPEQATFEEEVAEYEEEPAEYEEEQYEEEPDQAYTEVAQQDQDFEETSDDEAYEIGDEEEYEDEGEQDYEPTFQAARKTPAAKKGQTAARKQNTAPRRRGNPVLFFSIIGGFVGLVIIGAIVYRVVKKRNESKEQSAPLMI